MTNTLDDVFEREGSIYCRPCLTKTFTDSQFKPMIYSDTKKIMAESAENQCPKCSGSVFDAEKVQFNGKVFHQNWLVHAFLKSKLAVLPCEFFIVSHENSMFSKEREYSKF